MRRLVKETGWGLSPACAPWGGVLEAEVHIRDAEHNQFYGYASIPELHEDDTYCRRRARFPP